MVAISSLAFQRTTIICLSSFLSYSLRCTTFFIFIVFSIQLNININMTANFIIQGQLNQLTQLTQNNTRTKNNSYMPLGRTLKQYKHFMRTLVSQLIIHESIRTTHAKAKRLRVAGNKIIKFAKRADAGQTSPLNLLKGRLRGQKVQKKLLLDIIPRLKGLKHGNYVNISKGITYRRGDGAPIVTISIVGNQKSSQEKIQRKQRIESGQIIDYKKLHTKKLIEEKQFYESILSQKPQMQKFFRPKLDRVDFELWTLKKTNKDARRYTMLV